jgi:hypothetical protein
MAPSRVAPMRRTQRWQLLSAAASLAAVRTWDDPMFRLGGMAAEEMMRRQDGDILYGADKSATKSNGLSLHPYWESKPSCGIRWALGN